MKVKKITQEYTIIKKGEYVFKCSHTMMSNSVIMEKDFIEIDKTSSKLSSGVINLTPIEKLVDILYQKHENISVAEKETQG